MWWYCFHHSQRSLNIAIFLSENFTCFNCHSVLCRASRHSLHLFLTWVLPSQSLWISVSSGPTVKLLAFFISSFCSVYASDFLTSPASPCPSIASKARPAGFGCFPSRALRGSSSHSVPPCPSVPLRAERRGFRGLARRTPDGLGMCYVVSRGQGLRGPASAVNHDSKRW